MTWIERALEATGTASVRRRRLPAEQVVWLVIALALYRHQSMPEVLATLDLSLPAASGRTVSKSAITQARQRLGARFDTSAYNDFILASGPLPMQVLDGAVALA